MIYLILYRRRHPISDKLTVTAHPIAFDLQSEADKACTEVGNHFKCPSWIIECPEPRFEAPLKLVKNVVE